MAPWPAFVLAGALIGTLLGLFGVGGSSIATPVLSLLGVPGLIAVASPLPATIPGAVTAAVAYVRSGEARPRAGGLDPPSVGSPPRSWGALCRGSSAGPSLLVASGVMLGVVGWRVLQPIEQAARDLGHPRRQNRPLLVAAASGVGLFTGLLANGGGFSARTPLSPRVRPENATGPSARACSSSSPRNPDPDHALGARPHRLDHRAASPSG